MDFAALEVALLAVLSPILLAVGILHILSTAHLGASALAFNGLAVVVGTLRFAWNPTGNAGGLITVCLCLFVTLALAANVRAFQAFRRSGLRLPSLVPGPSGETKAPPATDAIRPQTSRAAEGKDLRILSPTSWVLRNAWGDIRVYTVPQGIADQNHSLPSSDRKLRITYSEDEDPLEGIYTISPALQILLPPEHLERLKEKELVRFEIVG